MIRTFKASSGWSKTYHLITFIFDQNIALAKGFLLSLGDFTKICD